MSATNVLWYGKNCMVVVSMFDLDSPLHASKYAFDTTVYTRTGL